MRPRQKSAVLWGVIGALAFLAGVQALQFLTSATVTVPVALGVALLVGLGAGSTAHWLEGRVGPAFRAETTDCETPPGGKEQS